MGPGPQTHLLPGLAVASQGPVLVTVGADQVGQHLGVAAVGLGTGDGVPFPIASSHQGIDGVDGVAAGDQGVDQQAMVGLDCHHHLAECSSASGSDGPHSRGLRTY